MRSRVRSVIVRASALTILGVLLASALIPSAGSAVTIQPGVIFQPSQSWANLSFSSTQTFNGLLGPGSGGPPNTCPNQPTISGTPPITTFPGSGVTFGGLSSDPDADPLTWTWTWDDGTTTDQSTPPGIGQVTASHAWAV